VRCARKATRLQGRKVWTLGKAVQKIDKEEYQKRLDAISTIVADMMRHVDVVSQERCPYKNRLDQCTAQFGCRNQRTPEVAGEPFLCVGDDKLDYRSAWETG